MASEIIRIQPKEIIVPESFRVLLDQNSEMATLFGANKTFSVSYKPNNYFVGSSSRLMDLLLRDDPKKLIKAQISTDITQSFSKVELIAGSALLTYISHIFPCQKPIFRIPELKHENHMVLDATALQALEIIKTSKDMLKKVSCLII